LPCYTYGLISSNVTLIGNITRDPAIKTTETGKKIALFTIATNRYYKSAEGENKSESEFHNCV
jgi:single-strand DNA-binding protein